MGTDVAEGKPESPTGLKADAGKTDGKSSPEVEEPEKDGDEDSVPEGPLHKSERWKQVHGELKQFKALGYTPEETAAALKRLAYYDQILAQPEKEEDEPDESAEEKKQKAQIKAARKELLKIYPELATLQRIGDSLTLYSKSAETRAFSETTKLMKEAGMDAEKEDVSAMSEMLARIIEEDVELYAEYIGGNPRGAVQDAFKRFKTKLERGLERTFKANIQRDKSKLTLLPKAPKPGGSPEVGGKDTGEPKNLNEARKSAERRLAQME